MQQGIIMIDNRNVVYAIERALDARPFCSCGRTTSPVAHIDGIWLECSSLSDVPEGPLGRLIAALSSGAHTRKLIVDLPAAAA
jgi:hypothetical protein